MNTVMRAVTRALGLSTTPDRFTAGMGRYTCTVDNTSSTIDKAQHDTYFNWSLLSIFSSYPRSETVLVAGMRTLEILADRSDRAGKIIIQRALATADRAAADTPRGPSPCFSPSRHETLNSVASCDEGKERYLLNGVQEEDDHRDANNENKVADANGMHNEGASPQSNSMRSNDVDHFDRNTPLPSTGGSTNDSNVDHPLEHTYRAITCGGTASFTLNVADLYSRDDSKTIVRRAGAARTAASALSLLRAVLTDADLSYEGEQNEEGGAGSPSLSSSSAIDDFVRTQVRRTLIYLRSRLFPSKDEHIWAT